MLHIFLKATQLFLFNLLNCMLQYAGIVVKFDFQHFCKVRFVHRR
jgi:hypothetical protein